ncbi:YesL family protein [Parafrigoribacterium soli]|uniref:YesL family protein n=1 Tax=Parafrigoribacterium soli TaxID=3144663 RepID=UPI0032EB19E4
MRAIPHGVYSAIFGVVYLGLMTNALLVVGCLPLIALLVTTDPAYSWPLIVVAIPLCAPSLSATFAVFGGNAQGDPSVLRLFLRAWRLNWRPSMLLGSLVAVALTVLLVDVRFFAGGQAGVVIIPVLAVLTALSLALGAVGLVAIAEEPRARLRTVVTVSLYFLARRWYLTAVSLAVLIAQAVLFSSIPAIALGVTATPALYLVWANSRYSLRPAIDTESAAVA